ncbi:spore germination protein [Clostridium carboxidivorans P7]|uniref:GerA spore germination protein n=1 Tax=Clostridium carboxidivorans P7 TaxID=536227 RepID=C6PN93_9CLOT|nr:spore germination protein [Clostridium carboxidivorans]AKN33617.1 spore germination protein [Clostridium carboxidivorans P7]EET89214.1 GerA spore germination protein [Clostridium carboxidivorans P7]EFG86794.1 putative spore germination protein KA [Clostridium carboxidivorans P7]
MENKKLILQQNLDDIKNLMGNGIQLITKNFVMGSKEPIEACIIYVNGLVNKDMIDRDILNPLMLHIEENLSSIPQVEDYVCKKYITISNTQLEKDINKAVDAAKRGKTLMLVQESSSFIIIDTTGGNFRAISDPMNETSLRGPRDSFVENLETNLSIIRRRLKDKNLKMETFTLGERSQTDLVIVYIDDIVDKSLLKKIKDRIQSIKVDSVSSSAMVEQLIEEHTYSIFPQTFATERPDIVQSNLLEGRIALMPEGTPSVITLPSLFTDFFQTVEDYYHRTIVASFTRIIKCIAVFIVITISSVYITLIKFNSELIPLTFIQSIIESRKGIALTPFMSILSMNLVIEFLREGGLRLPSKIGQTLSVVGGIIIGDAALKAKIVSSLTLLIVGVTTTASFLIPNYEMALSIRMINYPMLVLANWLGALGIAIGWFFLIAYLCALDSYGVPYLSFHKSDLKDIFIRAPIWKMNKRPEAIPNNNPVRQKNFRWKFRRGKNG